MQNSEREQYPGMHATSQADGPPAGDLDHRDTGTVEKDLVVSICDRSELSGQINTGIWKSTSAALLPEALLGHRLDALWDTRFVVAELSGSPVGLMAIYSIRASAFSVPTFDPAHVAPGIFGSSAVPADQFLIIGGIHDLVAGYAVVDGLSGKLPERVGAVMVEEAFAESRRLGMQPAALYVRNSQLQAFTGGSSKIRAVQQIDCLAEMEIPLGGNDDYPQSLNHSRRSVVRRDFRRLHELDLRGEVVHAETIIDESAPLVAAVKERHGIIEHPRITTMRMHGWNRCVKGRGLAFVVRDRAKRLLAVCFGSLHSNILELTEIGLAESDYRHLAYVEAMVYAPRRFAAENNCRTIQLGLGASRPKDLRGTRFTAVWAIGQEK